MAQRLSLIFHMDTVKRGAWMAFSVVVLIVNALALLFGWLDVKGSILWTVVSLGLVLGVPASYAAWTLLVMCGAIAWALLASATVLASEAADLATYTLAVAIVWGIRQQITVMADLTTPLDALVTWLRASGWRASHVSRGLVLTVSGIVVTLVLVFTTHGILPAIGTFAMDKQLPIAVLEAGPGAPLVASLVEAVPTTCALPQTDVARALYNPYVVLALHRPDVLRFYAANGWNPTLQCQDIYDQWLSAGAGGSAPTTAAAYVVAQGWVRTAVAPARGCVAAPEDVKRLGFDPYQLLKSHRGDVLALYSQNTVKDGAGHWNPVTDCVSIFNDWLQHPDGGPPTTAAAFVTSNGWAK